ncbi:50S ribosomal protein L9 [Durusdinium trenchii]|uniref:50S ribosomal protein L9, chloroplastic n=1 Tax=Durusdinium trenchii TaxID=1381693 RepID=A0ABP0NZW7_9DINO
MRQAPTGTLVPAWRQQRNRSASGLWLVLLFAAVLAGPAFSAVRSEIKQKTVNVVLLKDRAQLGQKGETIQVKRGYYRNYLFPEGIAIRETMADLGKLSKEKREKEQMSEEAKRLAMEQKDKIESHGTWVFEKKVREGSDKIYGSLSEINVAEEIVKTTAIPIRRASLSIPKVTTLGDFKGTVELAAGITATLPIKVVKQGATDEEAEETSE